MDFYRSGVTYTKNDPYKAPEINPLFHCVASFKHPDTGEWMALGLQGAGYGSPWDLSIYTQEQWDKEPGWVIGVDEVQLKLETLDNGGDSE